jgi:hypothetical protein
MRMWASILVILVTASLFASTWHSPPPAFRVLCPSDGSASTDFTGVSGLLEHATGVLKGGAPEREFEPGPLHQVRGRVLVYQGAAPMTASTAVGPSGRFRIALAPGRYRLAGESGRYPPGANGGTDPFDVQAGCLTSINVMTVTYLP